MRVAEGALLVVDQALITALLAKAGDGDREALEALSPLIIGDLRVRAAAALRRAPAKSSLSPTELVNEAFLHIFGQQRVSWQNRAHFLAHTARLMRWLLVDRARARAREKRGGARTRVTFDEPLALSVEEDDDVLALHDALGRLAQRDAEQAEIVVMRFFGGLSVEEVAAVKGVSKRSVEAEWTMIKAWLRRELGPG
ncbi:MAG: ECF-type sigma factor [Nannocystaceae bacterium]